MQITVTVRRYAAWITWGSIGVIALALFFLARSLPLEQVVHALQGWIGRLGGRGPVLFGLLYVLATVLFLPGVILTLAAGAIFGLWSGTAIVSLAATTGAAFAFLIARYLAREQVVQLMQGRPKFRALDQAIGEGGWKIVALLRLSPAIPFNVQNYLYGLTPLRFWPYLLTSWLAMLPGTFLYVYLGHITGAALGGERHRTTAEWVVLGMGLVATVLVTLYVTSLAKKKLREQTAISEQEDETAPAAQEITERQAAQARIWPWGANLAARVGLLFNPQMITRVFGALFCPHPATTEGGGQGIQERGRQGARRRAGWITRHR